MSILNLEIQETIRKNLPSAIADELTIFLKETKDLEKSFEEVIKDLKKTEKENTLLKEELGKKENLIQDFEKLQLREEEIFKKEKELEVTLLQKELELKNKSSEELFRLVDKIFGHPSVTITRSSNGQVPIPIDNGQWASTVDTHNSETTITTETKV